MYTSLMMTALLFACTADKDDTGETDAAEVFLAPDQPGVYSASTEEFGVTLGGLETNIQVWYPTEEVEGDLHEYDGLVTYGALDGEDAACETARPVVLFSHGNTGIRYQSMFLTEWLASRGYVVVAPDHKYNTFFDQDYELQNELVFRRPKEIAQSFDWLVEAAGESGHLLEGCVNGDDGYAVGGHSFGGYTTLAVAGAGLDLAAAASFCEQTGGWLCDATDWWAAENAGSDFADVGDADRVWAAFPQAPAGYEIVTGSLAGISAPTLVLGGGLDTLTTMSEQVEPIYQGLTGTPRYLGELVDADHFTFSDMCFLLPTSSDCENTQIDPDAAHLLINIAVTAHLDAARGFTEAAEWIPYETAEYSWTYEE